LSFNQNKEDYYYYTLYSTLHVVLAPAVMINF